MPGQLVTAKHQNPIYKFLDHFYILEFAERASFLVNCGQLRLLIFIHLRVIYTIVVDFFIHLSAFLYICGNFMTNFELVTSRHLWDCWQFLHSKINPHRPRNGVFDFKFNLIQTTSVQKLSENKILIQYQR